MPTLTYCDVDGVERTCELGAAAVMAGRNPDCTIRSEDGRVSRRHARFFVESGWVWVEDLGSANGVWVGATRVGARSPVPVGEVVIAGSLILRVVDPRVPPQVSPGVHAQLSEWLVTERKIRQGVEAERNAFAKRVGEVHDELGKAKAQAAGAEAAERRVAELEKRLAEAERKVREAEGRAGAAETRVAIAESRVAQVEKKAATPAAPAADPAHAARIAELEGELERVRRRLTETDAELDEYDKLKEAAAKMKAELAARPAAAATTALPPGFADQVAALSDSISSLRASMRAISDETAVMEQTESVQVVTSAATTAAEELERARDALRTLSAMSR